MSNNMVFMPLDADQLGEAYTQLVDLKKNLAMGLAVEINTIPPDRYKEMVLSLIRLGEYMAKAELGMITEQEWETIQLILMI